MNYVVGSYPSIEMTHEEERNTDSGHPHNGVLTVTIWRRRRRHRVWDAWATESLRSGGLKTKKPRQYSLFRIAAFSFRIC